jgi:hypothetical protein
MSCRHARRARLLDIRLQFLLIGIFYRLNYIQGAEERSVQLRVTPMKKYVVAAGIAVGALFGLSAQAAPLATNTTAIQTQVSQDGAIAKVQHWRWGSGGHHRRWGSGGHWRWGSHGGWHNRHRSHWRHGSRW